MKTKPINKYHCYFAYLIFILLGIPGVLFWIYFVNTDAFQGAESDLLRDLLTPAIVSFKGLPAEIINTLGIALSAFLASVTFSPQQLSFTRTQLSAIVILISVTLINVSVIVFFDEVDPEYKLYIADGELLLPKLINAANDIYKVTFSYILIIFGLQSRVEKSSAH